MPNWPSIREIVETTLHNHPKDCQFVENAADKIMHWLEINKAQEIVEELGEDALINLLVDAVQAHEIYCPHEGIDRRSEFQHIGHA